MVNLTTNKSIYVSNNNSATDHNDDISRKAFTKYYNSYTTDETVKQGPWLSYKIFLYYNEPELRYSVMSPIPVKPISKYLLVRTLFTKYRCTIL